MMRDKGNEKTNKEITNKIRKLKKLNKIKNGAIL